MALLLSSVAFFGITTFRDGRLLNHGHSTSAVVVKHLSPSQWWNIFDSGRLVVRYTADGETLTRTIWLDDTADARPVGATVTVIVDPQHPAHVRTRSDANDPIPWGPPFLVAGLAGLVMLLVGSTRAVGDVRERRWQRRVGALYPDALPWHSSGHVASGQPTDRIVLRYYRLMSRVPYIELSADAATFRIPAIFGGRRAWVVPIAETGVVDESLAVEGADTDPGWVFVDPIVAPYLATTTRDRAPNLRLAFRHPQRIPPVRLFRGYYMGVSYRRSRSSAGVFVDGVTLRAQNPAAAKEILAQAGAERVGAALPWLARYRRTTTDPVAVHEMAVMAKRGRYVGLLAFAALPCLLAARWGLDHTHGWWPYALGAGGLLVGFVAPVWVQSRNAAARRRLARREKQGSVEPR